MQAYGIIIAGAGRIFLAPVCGSGGGKRAFAEGTAGTGIERHWKYGGHDCGPVFSYNNTAWKIYIMRDPAFDISALQLYML